MMRPLDVSMLGFNNKINNFTGDKEELDYKVYLVTTPCNFGGVRIGFSAPLWLMANLAGVE